MALTTPIKMHKMATKIEDEPLPWYLVNTIIDPETGEDLQYKDIMKSQEKNKRPVKKISSKEFGILPDEFP